MDPGLSKEGTPGHDVRVSFGRSGTQCYLL